jgi:multiple sugar transport system substrate-binding protein
MRKFFVAALVCSCVAGAPVWPEPVTITFHRFSTAAHQAYLQPLLDAFAKRNPDVKVESVEHAVPGYEELMQAVLLSFVSGTQADVSQTGYTLVRTMVESGRVIALDPFIKADPGFESGRLYKSMMDLGTVDGKLYMFPLGTSTPVMYINVDAFVKAGLDPNKPPRTWEQTRTYARRLKKAGYDGILWGWSITGNWIYQTLIENAGGAIGSPDGKSIRFTEKPGMRALSYMQELVAEGLMPVTKDLVGTFAAGKLGILIESTFQRVAVPKNSAFKVRLAPIPTPDGSTPKVVAGGNGVMMYSRDPARQKAAYAFMRFLTEQEAGLIVAENCGYLPGSRAAVQALRRKYAGDKNMGIVLDQIERVTPWMSWSGSHGTEIQKTLMDMQEAVFLGKVDAANGLSQAAESVRAYLQ